MDGRDELNERSKPQTGGPLGALGLLLWLLGLIVAFVAVVEGRAITDFVGPAVLLLGGGLLVAADPALLYPGRVPEDDQP